jgi:hypothetical protein
MMRGVRWLTVLVPTIMSLACSSIHIQTGPPTDTELTQESEDRGRQLRIKWSDQLQQASPVQQASMMRSMIDSTTAQFVRFGYSVLDMWRTESNRRGSQLTAKEVREAIERSNQFDMPLLDAYEDVLEFGVELVTSGSFFDSPFKDKLTDYRNLYYDVYNAVFFPDGGLEDYERKLGDWEANTRLTSQTLAEELIRYQ